MQSIFAEPAADEVQGRDTRAEYHWGCCWKYLIHLFFRYFIFFRLFQLFLIIVHVFLILWVSLINIPGPLKTRLVNRFAIFTEMFRVDLFPVHDRRVAHQFFQPLNLIQRSPCALLRTNAKLRHTDLSHYDRCLQGLVDVGGVGRRFRSGFFLPVAFFWVENVGKSVLEEIDQPLRILNCLKVFVEQSTVKLTVPIRQSRIIHVEQHRGRKNKQDDKDAEFAAVGEPIRLVHYVIWLFGFRVHHMIIFVHVPQSTVLSKEDMFHVQILLSILFVNLINHIIVIFIIRSMWLHSILITLRVI